MHILHIETSTHICSVALSEDHSVIFERIESENLSHATHLGVFVQEALAFAQQRCLSIDAVAVSCGPGSYTGLRIGVSQAKGVCYGLDIPLIAIDTLSIIALAAQQHTTSPMLICPMIDARRMEVYTKLFDEHLKEITHTQSLVITKDSFAEELDKQQILFCGNGSDKVQAVIKHPHAHFLPNIHPYASLMVPLALQKFTQKQFEDVAYYEPFYLKEFMGTTPKKSILPQK